MGWQLEVGETDVSYGMSCSYQEVTKHKYRAGDVGDVLGVACKQGSIWWWRRTGLGWV